MDVDVNEINNQQDTKDRLEVSKKGFANRKKDREIDKMRESYQEKERERERERERGPKLVKI